MASRKRKRRVRGHLGVWDPIGGERSEVGIRRLTVLAGIIGPLTLLAGWWGANFESIPGAESRWGFGVFIGVQLVFVVLAVWFMARRGLL